MRLLNETADTISLPLIELIVHVLQYEVVPDDWKKALISVINKKGDKCQAGNYHPVSLMSLGVLGVGDIYKGPSYHIEHGN